MEIFAAASVPQVTPDDWWKICIVLGALLSGLYVGVKWIVSIQKYWVRTEEYERDATALSVKLATADAQIEKLSKRIDDMGQALLQSALLTQHEKSVDDRRRRERPAPN